MTSTATATAAVDNTTCPTCYVGPGRKCVTVHGNTPTTTHQTRITRHANA